MESIYSGISAQVKPSTAELGNPHRTGLLELEAFGYSHLMERVTIEAAYAPAFAAEGLTTFARISAYFCPDETIRRNTMVRPGTLGVRGGHALAVFYKQYNLPAGSWRFFGRPSKAQCEYRNYAVFQRLKIPAVERIAWGEQRDLFGRLTRAFIITRSLELAGTLEDFMSGSRVLGGGSASPSFRNALIAQIAEITRRLHEANFFHNDLYWRNLLITHQPPMPPKVWCIDCPRGRFVRWSPGRSRRRLKDLFALDLGAREWCRRPERLRFLKLYLRKPRVDAELKNLVRRLDHYYRRHRPASGLIRKVPRNPKA